MGKNISESAFEKAIETALVRPMAGLAVDGSLHETSLPYGTDAPGGYRKRSSKDYDRARCLIADDLLAFIQATQPATWKQLIQHYDAQTRERFIARVSREITRRGLLDVLRKGVKDAGCKFDLAYFRPASGLNEETRRKYLANQFSVVRQLHYSEKNENSLDMALFLNGLPLFTVELKNELTGQSVDDAIKQYKRDRDPREPLLKPGRCLAHFAVDPYLVYVTTALAGAQTRFLPFNQGKFGGAGNPPVPPTRPGYYPTSYLWDQIWSRDSVLNLISQFIHELPVEDAKGAKTGKTFIIFPRYQQLDAVRKLVADARAQGPGQRYLIQHSAGSGKSFTIAWLAHQLSTLHDSADQRVFDSIIVITDRRVLDKQLQKHVHNFEQTLGVVENIDTTSRQLKAALEAGKTIIVTTLQKFPVIADQVNQLPGRRFAVIVDEAHSSQSGESTKSLKQTLSVDSLEAAEAAEAGAPTIEEELDDVVEREAAMRGPQSHVSTFAFTATPKEKTLELFGVRRPDGKYAPFHLYSMRQAIEEGFILDVLQNYTTYKAYWKLHKTIEDDPRYERKKATALLKSYVGLHPHAIAEKVAIMIDHFHEHVQHRIDGQAKAMIVTRSRLHAVRYKLAVEKYLAAQGLPYKALVAFSGTVNDPVDDAAYTEANMNGLPDSQTAATFNQPGYRFLIVANKYQTGFDQPLLHTMYVDKQLGGVGAVQTLSRLNRIYPAKLDTIVLDFVNEADTIQKAFEPYYEATYLSEATDPNLLYDIQGRLLDFSIFTDADVEAFAANYFKAVRSAQDHSVYYQALNPVQDRFNELDEPEQIDFRGQVTDFVRLYAFLAQVITWTDTDLEKLYVFCRYLRRLVQGDAPTLPLDVQQNIDMDSYRIQQTHSGGIGLERNGGGLDPRDAKAHHAPAPDEIDPLSQIIADLNERFGLNLGPEHRLTLDRIMTRLDDDAALDASARVNTRENVRLTFDQRVEDVFQEIINTDFTFYKRITDDAPYGSLLKSYLFDQFMHSRRKAEELIKQGESKTLEFKSTLRWDVKLGQNNPRIVTHAVLKTIAAFLNTEGGDLLIGVEDDGNVIGIDLDGFESEDKFMLHLTNVIGAALGDRAGTCVDPKVQLVDGKPVCLVSCQRSPEPVLFKWKGVNKQPDGDFYVRVGPQTKALPPESAAEYIRTRF